MFILYIINFKIYNSTFCSHIVFFLEQTGNVSLDNINRLVL